MAKRLTGSSINWAALAERVPPEQRANLAMFKAKSDSYMRRVMANPPEPPKINWAMYKNIVPVPGLVDTFQKHYESLKVPYPADNLTPKVDAQWAEVKKAIDAFVQESNANVSKYQQEIAKTNALLAYDQMTMEDFKDAYPELALDPVNKPTFWPHNAEEQLDYDDPEKHLHQSSH